MENKTIEKFSAAIDSLISVLEEVNKSVTKAEHPLTLEVTYPCGAIEEFEGESIHGLARVIARVCVDDDTDAESLRYKLSTGVMQPEDFASIALGYQGDIKEGLKSEEALQAENFIRWNE